MESGPLYQPQKTTTSRRRFPCELRSHDPKMIALVQDVRKLAQDDESVLILGESGSGKEIFAHALHDWSPRRDQPFVALNMAGIPPDLAASEIFGHRKGAFTSAVDDRVGALEFARDGVVFLDEIGESPPSVQSSLLRALQEGEFARVGETDLRPLEARVVCATNADLKAAMEEHRFRADLYHRLACHVLVVPPLRERGGDIEYLAGHFLRAECRKSGKDMLGIEPGAMRLLNAYRWPGNVRELQQVIHHAVLFASGPVLGATRFPEEILALGRGVLGKRRRFEEWAPLVLKAIRSGLSVAEICGLLGIHRSWFHKLRKRVMNFELGAEGIPDDPVDPDP